MQTQVDEFLVPHLRRHRFWEAVGNSNHKVFPLWPGGCHHIPPLHQGIFDRDVDDESIQYLDDSDAEVAFPTGAINQTTVIEVSSGIGQDLMDGLELEQGARIWTPKARYYLFGYIETSALPETECMIRGLRVLNDGDWIPYPGNLMDGHLVPWEHDPWAVGTHPFPREFWEEWSPKPA